MGAYFSDPVEKALEYIYYKERAGKGMEGLKLLDEATAAKDGDACCILARCMSGSGYVWPGHHFRTDDQLASSLLHKSVELGSAIGVLTALRSGELTPSLEKKMPFASLQEAFDEVLKKAEAGNAFCQYVIGNTYLWWDFLRIQGKGRDSFSSQQAYKAYLKENISKCEEWFQKALRGGIYFAANNLNKYYREGDEDIILPQPEKAKDLWKISAEQGHPVHQYTYARQLGEEEGRKEESLHWHKKAAEGGQLDSWYYIGRAYEEGEIVPKDPAYAAQCYEKGLTEPNDSGEKVGCANCLGAMYFYGDVVPQDYARAYQLLRYGYEKKSDWGVYYLGKCCFAGLGTQQDYVKAREYLEKVDWDHREVYYMLGYIYGRGLGVPEDIKKGVEYLQKAGTRKEAKEELLHYKKTLFGKWVRR